MCQMARSHDRRWLTIGQDARLKKLVAIPTPEFCGERWRRRNLALALALAQSEEPKDLSERSSSKVSGENWSLGRKTREWPNPSNEPPEAA